MLQAPEERYVLRNQRNDTVIAIHLEPAFDSASRRKGLLGRAMFDQGSALIIAPCSGIHTFFMRIAIDVAFVSRSGEILKTYSSLRPWRVAVAAGAFAAIELPSGTLSRSDTRRGDPVCLTIR